MPYGKRKAKCKTKRRMGKKGVKALETIGSVGVAVATLAIILVVTFLIMAQGQDQIVDVQGIDESNTSTWTVAYNGTNTLTGAVEDIPGWVPLIVLALIGSILLGLVALFRR